MSPFLHVFKQVRLDPLSFVLYWDVIVTVNNTPTVYRSSLTRQRLVLVFLAGVLLFFSPILKLFDRQVIWLGVPVLYLYLFGAWAVLIAVTAWIAGRRDE